MAGSDLDGVRTGKELKPQPGIMDRWWNSRLLSSASFSTWFCESGEALAQESVAASSLELSKASLGQDEL